MIRYLMACLLLVGLSVGLLAEEVPAEPTKGDYGVVVGPTPQADSWARKNGYEFVQVYKQPLIWHLYLKHKQVGTWKNQKYYPFDPETRTFFPATLPPWAPKALVDESGGEKPVMNFGLDREKISDSPPYTVNGRPATRLEALAAMGEDGIPDDGDLAQVVAIGDEAFLKKVADDWAKETPYHQSAVLHCYGPDNWWAKESGLESESLIVVDKDGKALHLQKGFNVGDFKLFGQVFDPKAVPDVRNQDQLAGLVKRAADWVKANQMLSLAIAAGLAYWLYTRNKAK